MRKLFLSGLIVLSAPALPVLAQIDQEVKKKFPGEEAVVLESSVHYRISLKNGEPDVESSEKQQLLFLSDNTSAYMSRYGFSHSSFHQVLKYEAYTRTPQNKTIKVTEFKTTDSKSNSIFYDDVKETMFDFPSISPGAIGTLEMTTHHKDAHLLSPFYFSRRVPLINAELKISFPKSMVVRYIVKGLEKERVKFSEDSRRGEITYTFKASDMPGEKSYPDAPESAYYSTHVIFFIDRYKNEKGDTVRYLSTVDDLHRLNYSYVKNINKEIGPELKQITDSIIRNLTSVEQKARAIYKWVQQSIKYVAFEAGMEGFIPRDANLVCSRRFGDCKDMSSILTVMLNYAGIPAYYTWIGTRHIPYDYTEVPTPIVDNHMICTIRLNDEYIFLDGTDPTCVFGTPSEHIQGKQALLAIDEKNYKILRVGIPAKETNQFTDTSYLQLTDKGIKGSISINMKGYYSMNTHSALKYVNEKEKEEYFRNLFRRGSNKFRLEKYDVPRLDNNDHISLSGQFDLQDYAKKVAGDWYINMNLFKPYEHREIDYPKRKIPIEFPHLSVQKYVTVLEIPEGYKVAYLPASKSYKNDVWGFNIRYEQKNNQVILTQEFENNHILLTPEKFAEWNKVLEQLFPLYKETVNLTKK
jgi:hypothetical protein